MPQLIPHMVHDGEYWCYSTKPKMKVEPSTSTAKKLGKTFTINITVSEVTELWGWELKLFYNSAQLNGTDVKEGPFLKTAGETFFWIVNMTDNYNATSGYIRAICVLTHVIPGANETGTIANITFKSKAIGKSILDITETKLKNSTGEYMPHETRDGTIIVGKLGNFDEDIDIDYDDILTFVTAYITYWTTGDP